MAIQPDETRAAGHGVDAVPSPDVVWLRLETLSPRARRELDRIVAAAVVVADREGLAALSMRRLATELDTGTTTLYRYVTGRDELLELMVDTVNGSDGVVTGKPDDWRAGLALVAREARARFLAHPWLASQLVARPTIGPNTLLGAEFVIAIALELVDDPDTAAAVTSSLMAYVQGSVAAELAEREAQRRTGLDEHAWRETVAPWVRSILADARFPAFAQVVLAADDLSFEDRFTFGLERLLDGFATLAPSGHRRPRTRETGS
jgi:AcrR family transcriptional regulator